MTVLDMQQIDAETRTALRRLIVSLADSKRMMGIRYSDWLLGAPSIETGIAASSMAQDEWGHARLLYAMLKEFGEDPFPVEHDRAASEYASVAALDRQMPDWAALVAAIVLVDGALTAMLGSFAEGSFDPARSRVSKMLSEEEFHASLGAAWYRRLAGSGGEAATLLREASASMLPSLRSWLGAADEAALTLVEAGVIEPAADRLRRFDDAVREFTALVEIDVDAVEAAGIWDAARGRTAGAPEEEAVERARGDRNRALFVE
jgi:1,2-phenylacetyl-CoA epoxidase catalytic subunit